MKQTSASYYGTWLVVLIFVLVTNVMPYAALANPTGGTVSAGSASIASSGNTLTVNQSSDKAVIDWRGFDIATGETANFQQPSSSSLTLNRVNSSSPSFIDGNLNANGNIIIINQNGVLFGKGSQVNVNSLLATTADIDTSQFMAGSMNFNKPGNPTATIENQGLITAQQAGLVGLVAPNVLNSGVINAKLGHIYLSSGDTATVDLYGDGLLEVKASPALQSQLVTNTGTLNAAGGTIAMTAAAAAETVNSLINVGGTLQANAVGTRNGKIYIYAEGSNAVSDNVAANKGQKTGSSTVLVSGTIEAKGRHKGQKGGTVQVLADNVGILSGAKIDASGKAGGGTIQIGGDFHGQGSTPTALHTIVQSGSSIKANAVTSGNGGNVTVWADDWTHYAGSIEATGGANSGNGGFVETSGHNTLALDGTVNAAAPYGIAGSWLLDPNNVIIDSTDATNNTGSSPNFSDTGSSAYVNTADIVSALNGGTSVNVTASGSLAVNSSIAESSYNGTESLILKAGTDITLASNVGITASGSTKLNVTLDSDTAGAGGAIVLNSGSSITSNGGSITMGGGSSSITAGTLNSDGSVITAAAGFAVGDAASQYGIYINNATVNAGNGILIANGQGVNNSSLSNNTGIYIAGTSALLETTGGNIYISGKGGIGTGGGAPYYLGQIGVVTVNSGLISSLGGTISITGVGGSGSSFDNDGIFASAQTTTGNIYVNGTGGSGSQTMWGIGLSSGVESFSSTSGNIALYGTGGTASGGRNDGIAMQTGTINTGGNISLTGIAGSGGTNYGIHFYAGTDIVGGSSTTGSITLRGDTIQLDSSGLTLSIQTTGNTTILPFTANKTIGVAGASGALGVSSTLLGDITSGSITIGAIGDTGTLTLPAYTWATAADLITGSGSLSITGTQTMGAYNLTLQSDNISIAGNLTGTGTLTILPSTLNDTVGVATGSGTLNITSTQLNYIQNGWNSIVIGSTSDTGLMSVNSYAWNAPVTFNNGSNDIDITNASGSLNFTHALNANTTTGNVNLTATTDIIESGVGSIITQGGNITLDSNSGGGGAGAISLAGVTYNSNGGNITLGGGASAITAGAGYAVGDAANPQGILIGNGGGASINAGAGSIIINGQGYASTSNGNFGINIAGGSTIQTTGLSNITLSGIAGGTGMSINNVGVCIQDAGTKVSSVNGNIIITGTGGSTTGTNDYGTLINTGAMVQTTGTGAISLTGTGGGTGASAVDYGVNISGTVQSTSTGSLTLIGYGGDYGGSGSQQMGIYIAGTVSSSGNIVIDGNTGGSGSIPTTTGSGNWGVGVSGVVQTTANGSITLNGIGGGSGGDSSGVELVSSGAVITSASGNISITGTGASAPGGPNFGVYLVNNAAVYTTGSGNISLTGTGFNGNTDIYSSQSSGTNPIGGALDTGNITFTANTISFSSTPIQTTGTVTFAPYTASTSIGFSGGTGTLAITQAIMDSVNAPTVVIGETNSTGALTTGAFTWENTLNNLYLEGGSDTIGGNITKSSGTNNATINIVAGADIALSSNVALSSSSTFGKMNTVLDADYAGAGGSIVMNSGSSITTNGGNITMGGGTSTITAGTGYAVGDTASSGFGINIGNGGVTLNAAGGSITMNGQGFTASSGSNYGIYFQSGSIVQVSGSGAITLNGIGGGSTGDNNYGLNAASGSTIQTSGTGAIVMNGTGGGTGVSNDDYGVMLNGIVQTTATNSGSITIKGFGGDTGGSGNSAYGAYVGGNVNSTATNGGSLTLIGYSGNNNGSGGDDQGIHIAGTISSVDGNIIVDGNRGINGQAVSNTTGGNGGFSNIGVYSTGTISATGNASIALSGDGAGSGASNSDYGIFFFNGAKITSAAGNIAITTSDNGSNFDIGFYSETFGANNLIGGSSATGNITFNADSIDISNTAIQTTGTVTFAPYTTSTSIGFSGGTGTLTVSQSTMDMINAPTVVVGRADSTGALTTGNFTWESTLNNLYLEGGSDTIGGNITSGSNSGAQNKALTVIAGTDITMNSGNSISSSGSYGQLATTLDSDYAGAGGALVLNGGITTNGGNVILGGGLTPSTGYAVGDAANINGIDLAYAVNAGGGNITMNGRGYAGTANGNDGIYTEYGIAVQTSGNGTINLTGIGGGTGASSGNIGVRIGGPVQSTSGNITLIGYSGDNGGSGSENYGTFIYIAALSSVNGDILINGNTGISGQGITTTTGYDNYGITVYNDSTISATGTGSITFTGIGGGSGSGGNNTGVYLQVNPQISTISGNIIFNGTGGSSTGGSDYGINLYSNASVISTGGGNMSFTGIGGSGNTGIVSSTGSVPDNILGGASDTGNITFKADTMSFAGFSAQTTGTITFTPYTANTSIGFSGGAGTLQVTQATMDMINAPTVVIGRTDSTGALTTGNFTWESTLNNLYLEGGSDTIGGNITKSSGTNNAALNIIAGTDITINNNEAISSSGSHGQLSTTLDSDYAGNGGAIAITYGSSIATNGGNVVMGGGATPMTGYAVGDMTDTDGIFLQNTLVNAAGGNITMHGEGYAAGTGNGNSGIGLFYGTNLQTSGTGTINLTGIGGGAGASSNNYGINLTAATVQNTSGGSDITLIGYGGDNSGSGLGNYGTYIYYGTISSADGNILIDGNTGVSGQSITTATGGSDHGVYVFTSTVQSTGAGNINITGIGGGSNASGTSDGVFVADSSQISTVSGNIILNGTGGTSTGGSDFGVQFYNTDLILSTGGGNVTFTGVGGNGNTGIVSYIGGAPSNIFGGASDTGNITFNADTIGLSSFSVQTTGTVTFAPYTASTSIGFSGGAGTLGVSQGIMNAVNAPTVVVGRTDSTGALTTGAFTWESTLNNLYLEGGSDTIGGNITKSSGTNNAALNVIAGTDIIVANSTAISSSGSYGRLTTTLDSNYQANGGSIVLDPGSSITTNGGDIVMGGGVSPSTGDAVGDSASSGIGINLGNSGAATINAGNGNITMNGKGYTSGNYLAGVAVASGSIVQTSGAGVLAITGIGGGSGASTNIYGVLVQGTVQSISGTGGITITGYGGDNGGSGGSNYGVYNSGTISSANGNIAINGNTGLSSQAVTSATGNDNYGIYSTGTISTSGTASVTLKGIGGGTGASGSDPGINVTGTVQSTATNGGGITLIGYGGDNGGTGTDNDGVDISGTVSSVDGNILIDGNTGISGQAVTTTTGIYALGIFIDNGSNAISATGNGSITLHGYGAGSGSYSYGVFLYSGSLASTTGAISITGTGANGGGGTDEEYGVYAQNSSIQTTSGDITFTGNGGAAPGHFSEGIYLSGNFNTSTPLNVQTQNGNILFNGTGGSGSYGEIGIEIDGGATVQATGSGSITLNGIAGNGTDGGSYANGNVGVEILNDGFPGAADASVIVNSGNLSITGTGNGAGIYNTAILLDGQAIINSTGSGSITLSGHSPASTPDIVVHNDYGSVNSIGSGSTTGNITLIANEIDASNLTGIETTGNVLIKPYTASTTIGVAGGAGTLAVTSTLLSDVTASSIVIGSNVDTGAMTLGTESWSIPVSFVTGSSGSITVAGAQTGTGNASLSFTGPTTLDANLTTVNQVITLNSAANLGANVTVSAGSGTLTFGSSVNGNDNLTASAGTFSFASAWGGTTPLGTVSLTSTNSLSLPSITASSITAQTTGATSDITLPSGTILTASGTGTAIIIAAGRNFINTAGSGALSTSNGRWLIYSTAPTADTFGSLNSNDTAVWDTTYGGTITQSGDRYVFAYQPTVTFTSVNDTKTYGTNGTTTVAADYTVSGLQAAVSGVYLTDTNATAFSGAPSVTSSGSAASAHVNGGPYAITVAQGNAAELDGYALAYSSAGQLTVNPATLTGIITASNKPYDGTTTATLASETLSGTIYGSDANNLSLTDTAANFNTKDVMTANIVTATGLTLTGSAASDYQLSSTSATAAASITKQTLDVTANNRTIIYGNTIPIDTLSYSGFVSGENAGNLTTAPTIASAQSGAVNAGTYTGNYTLSGGVSDNYSFVYANGNLTVYKRNLTVIANSENIFLGDTEPTFTGNNNLIARDAPLISWTYAPIGYTGAVGTYLISASAFDPQSRLANYNVHIIDGTFSVFLPTTAEIPNTVLVSSQNPVTNFSTYLQSNYDSAAAFGNGNNKNNYNSKLAYSTTRKSILKNRLDIEMSPALRAELGYPPQISQ